MANLVKLNQKHWFSGSWIGRDQFKIEITIYRLSTVKKYKGLKWNRLSKWFYDLAMITFIIIINAKKKTRTVLAIHTFREEKLSGNSFCINEHIIFLECLLWGFCLLRYTIRENVYNNSKVICFLFENIILIFKKDLIQDIRIDQPEKNIRHISKTHHLPFLLIR